MKKYRKKKVKKYNKFFSYKNADRAKRNFSYKDFGYSESYNTKFTGSLFYGNNFYRATMKYCGFNGYSYLTETLTHRLGGQINYGRIRVILEAMKQLNLIQLTEGLSESRITLNPTSGKVNLEAAPVIQALKEAIR